MNNLIPQTNNVFFRVWNWIKKIFHTKKSNKTEVQNYSKDTNDVCEIKINLEESNNYKKHVYVQDLDYEVEKKRTVELCQDVINNKRNLNELDFSDIIKIKKLLDN